MGKNKVHENGTVSLPKKVLDILGVEKGEDIIGFKKRKEENVIEICTVEVDF